ncbi:MAG: FapA family protein [Lachnospiraceae bacterium]|nr:FapA family protein [Lachnospiraceae bacterium]
MDLTVTDFIRIQISEDSMQARLCFSTSPGSDGRAHPELFTRPNVDLALAMSGVKAGINTKLIEEMIEKQQYDTYQVVAAGKVPENGVSGSFAFHFNIEHNNKPKILEDGSVDYRSIEGYEPCQKDQLLATYTPATSGHFGYNVKGAVLQNVRGKEQLPLTGKGFYTNEDKTEYYANCDGKVELKNSKELTVSNVLEIRSDVDLTTGDVEFNGDVIVHGAVISGSTIKVTGNLTIMGNVEGAHIIAVGDITLSSGMQGGGRGLVEAKGDVYGKFFEQARLRVGGDLHASSMMNCDCIVEGNMYVTGRHGILVGGHTSCQGDVEATIIGNLAEAKTYLDIGVTDQNIQLLNTLERKLREFKDKLEKHYELRAKLNAVKNPANTAEYESMKKQVDFSIEELQKQNAQAQEEYDQLKLKLAAYSFSKIRVYKSLYRNVIINLSGGHYNVGTTYSNVSLRNVSGEVKVYSEGGM